MYLTTPSMYVVVKKWLSIKRIFLCTREVYSSVILSSYTCVISVAALPVLGRKLENWNIIFYLVFSLFIYLNKTMTVMFLNAMCIIGLALDTQTIGSKAGLLFRVKC